MPFLPADLERNVDQVLRENGMNRAALGLELVALVEAGLKVTEYVVKREGPRPGMLHSEYLEVKAAVDRYLLLLHGRQL